MTWEYKEEWWQRGKNFLVVVKRFSVDVRPDVPYAGPHRWAVYAFIYPGHPMFPEFSGRDMWQPAATALPLHGGPSLLRWHYNDDGTPSSVQVGADYNHLHDTHFTTYATKVEAAEVFSDAEELFEHLS